MAEFIYSFNKKSLSGYKNYNTDSLFSGEICIEWACVVVLYGKAVGTMACSGKMLDTEFLCVRLYIYKINIQNMNFPPGLCVSFRVVRAELRLGELPAFTSGTVRGGTGGSQGIQALLPTCL